MGEVATGEPQKVNGCSAGRSVLAWTVTLGKFVKAIDMLLFKNCPAKLMKFMKLKEKIMKLKVNSQN